MCVLVAQSCPTLYAPWDFLLEWVGVEWVAISFSRGSSQPRDQTQVSCIVGRLFTIWATGEVNSPEPCKCWPVESGLELKCLLSVRVLNTMLPLWFASQLLQWISCLFEFNHFSDSSIHMPHTCYPKEDWE